MYLISSHLLRDNIPAFLTSVYCLDTFPPSILSYPISIQTWHYFSHLRKKNTLLISRPSSATDLGLSSFLMVKLVKSIADTCYLFSHSLFSFLLNLLFSSISHQSTENVFIKIPNNICVAKYGSQYSILIILAQFEAFNSANHCQTKIMASGPITSWEIDGETVETVADYFVRGWSLYNQYRWWL